jgi:dCMP deaminase
MVRPSWDDIWTAMAVDISKRSLCSRSQAGCVIVSRDNQVLAASYNGPPPRFDHQNLPCTEWCPRTQTGGGAAFYDDCFSTHAEAHALTRAPFSLMDGGTAYVTRMPCFTCAKMLASSPLKQVVCRIAPEDRDREPERSIMRMRASGLEVRLQPDG